MVTVSFIIFIINLLFHKSIFRPVLKFYCYCAIKGGKNSNFFIFFILPSTLARLRYNFSRKITWLFQYAFHKLKYFFLLFYSWTLHGLNSVTQVFYLDHWNNLVYQSIRGRAEGQSISILCKGISFFHSSIDAVFFGQKMC